MGTSTRPVLFTAPTREKTLVPLLFSVPMAAIPFGAVVDDLAATLAQVSTLLITVGLPQRPAAAGIGRPGAGLADIAFHGGDEGRFFAADKGPGALADLDVEVEAGAQDIGAQEARFPGLVDGQGQALHRQGIFVAHVDIALVGADGVSRR